MLKDLAELQALSGSDLHDEAPPDQARAEAKAIAGPGDVAELLAARLRQLEAAEIPAAEKVRLTATLADALLRALSLGDLEKRLAALEQAAARRG